MYSFVLTVAFPPDNKSSIKPHKLSMQYPQLSLNITTQQEQVGKKVQVSKKACAMVHVFTKKVLVEHSGM